MIFIELQDTYLKLLLISIKNFIVYTELFGIKLFITKPLNSMPNEQAQMILVYKITQFFQFFSS